MDKFIVKKAKLDSADVSASTSTRRVMQIVSFSDLFTLNP